MQTSFFTSFSIFSLFLFHFKGVPNQTSPPKHRRKLSPAEIESILFSKIKFARTRLCCGASEFRVWSSTQLNIEAIRCVKWIFLNPYMYSIRHTFTSIKRPSLVSVCVCHIFIHSHKQPIWLTSAWPSNRWNGKRRNVTPMRRPPAPKWKMRTKRTIRMRPECMRKHRYGIAINHDTIRCWVRA